jgi:putative endopeptidase
MDICCNYAIRFIFGACVFLSLLSGRLFAQSESAARVDSIDQSAVGSKVRPQDDFFGYANGSWIKSATIPSYLLIVGGVYQLFVTSMDDRCSLLDSLLRQPDAPPGSIRQQIADFYFSLLDSATLDAKGIVPITRDAYSIDWISKSQIPRLED